MYHRIIAIENVRKPVDYYEAILLMGELGVLSAEFAQNLAPLAGFRNALIHEYLVVDWDQVYKSLENLDDLKYFAIEIQTWLSKR